MQKYSYYNIWRTYVYHSILIIAVIENTNESFEIRNLKVCKPKNRYNFQYMPIRMLNFTVESV